MIAGDEPDLILLTEVIPKAQVLPISPSLLSNPGYVVYTNFDPSKSNLGASGTRGISVYVTNKIRAVEVAFANPFQEQLWVTVKPSNSDKLVIGCIYRSPSGDNVTSVTELGNLLREVCSSDPSHLLVLGDFNVPHIDWVYWDIQFSPAPDGHCSHILLEAIADCFLYQHVRQPTRYRVGESQNTLDLILSNEEGLIHSLSYLPGVGTSDHITLRFQMSCYTNKVANKTAKYNFWRANFETLNKIIRDVSWDEMLEFDLDQSYTFIKMKLLRLCEQCVPISKKQSKKKNLFMTSEAMNLRKKKRVLWFNYIRSQDIVDYARFRRCRNKLQSQTRRLRRKF